MRVYFQRVSISSARLLFAHASNDVEVHYNQINPRKKLIERKGERGLLYDNKLSNFFLEIFKLETISRCYFSLRAQINAILMKLRTEN